MDQKRCYGCMGLRTAPGHICEHCGYDERTQNKSHQLPAGTVLHGQYQVGRVLGQGGFGITYLGWDLVLDIPVAIKEFYPGGIASRDCTLSPTVTGGDGELKLFYEECRSRFLREARTLARFASDPVIVQVRYFFEANGTAYIIMEYVQGMDLRKYTAQRGGRLSAQETLRILQPVMAALGRVHEANLVHRDISPDNIMLLPAGGVKLLDFGAVRDAVHGDANQVLTQSTQAIVKPGFAPIEQYQRRGGLGSWTDVYALCATMYYCMTGQVPADAPERMTEDVDPDWRSIPGLTAQQIAVLEKGMELRARDRIQTVQELYNGLYGTPVQPVMPIPEPVPIPVKPVPEKKERHSQIPEKKAAPARDVTPEKDVIVKTIEKPVRKPGKGLVGAIAGVAALALVAGALFLLPRKEKDPEVKVPQQTESQTQPAETAPPVTMPKDAPWVENMLRAQPTAGMLPEREENTAVNEDPESDEVAFGTAAARSEILTVTFLDTLKDAPEDAVDVSLEEDGSVLAWTLPTEGGYDLYIGAEGGINGAKSCKGLFWKFTNLKSVDFGDAFHTNGAVSMAGMFADCAALTAVDVSGFDTASVTDYDSMFRGCAALAQLDVSGFDTHAAENMRAMFAGCASLPEQDFGSWYLHMVTDSEGFMDEGVTVKGEAWETVFDCHTEEIVTPGKAATCTAGGLSDQIECSVCGRTLQEQGDIPPTGHVNIVTTARVEATCTAPGKTAGTKCQICGVTTASTQTIPALGHNYTSTVVNPTCTAGGYTNHTCTRCNASYQDNPISAKGHSFTTRCQNCGATGCGEPCYICGRSDEELYCTVCGNSWN